MSRARGLTKAEQAALDAELEREIARLLTGVKRGNAVEAVMRLRALAEISAWLDTESLVALVVRVTREAGAYDPAKRLS